MQRLSQDRERGATAVIFALLLTVLVGFVGLAVDVGASYAKKQELQNGADAAALAVAQQCATEGCTGDTAMADLYLVGDSVTPGNVRNETDTVTSAVSYPAANQVRVEARGDQTHWFMPVLGSQFESTNVVADATAAWGPPAGGTTIMPLTFSICDFEGQGGASGVPATILFTKTSPTDCTDPVSGNVMPAGFAFIGDTSICGGVVEVDGWVESQTGNTPQGCDASYLTPFIGEVVLLPIFDNCRIDKKNTDSCEYVPGSETNGAYHIYAFAAFELHGFNFGGQFKAGSPVPCGGNDRCVRGAFVEYVELDDAFDYGPAPDLGASIVTLID